MRKPDRIPIHVGIIPDGNRRWAKKHGVDLFNAYETGYKKLVEIIKYLNKRGIQYVSVYGLSYDNCRNRPIHEKKIIEDIAIMALRDLRRDRELEEKGIRVLVLGDPGIFSSKLYEEVQITVDATKNRDKGILLIGICYSGSWETRKFCKSGSTLPSLSYPPIDLIIRTGGMRRLSGFFPLLSEYAELYFMDKLWPEITIRDVDQALDWFARQPRNFGR